MKRTWTELQSSDDAIDLIREWQAQSKTPSVIIDAVPAQGRRALEQLQVTTRSALGAVAFHTGGLVIEHGWFRVLGSGSPEVPRSLDTWNGLGGERRCDAGLLVADDALGGFFCWFESPRTIHYLAPDCLEWEDLGVGYTDWLRWCFTDRLTAFYGDQMWDGWQDEVRPLPGDRAIHVSPPLVLKGPPIADRSRRPVPVEELWSLALDFKEQLSGVKNGTEEQKAMAIGMTDGPSETAADAEPYIADSYFAEVAEFLLSLSDLEPSTFEAMARTRGWSVTRPIRDFPMWETEEGLPVVLDRHTEPALGLCMLGGDGEAENDAALRRSLREMWDAVVAACRTRIGAEARVLEWGPDHWKCAIWRGQGVLVSVEECGFDQLGPAIVIAASEGHDLPSVGLTAHAHT